MIRNLIILILVLIIIVMARARPSGPPLMNMELRPALSFCQLYGDLINGEPKTCPPHREGI